MRKFFLSIRFILLLITVFLLVGFIYQITKVNASREELKERKGYLRELRGVKRKSKKIEEEIEKYKLKEEEVLRKIPKSEESILLLVRELASIADAMMIKNITFEMAPEKNKKDKESPIMRRRSRPAIKEETTGPIKPHDFKVSFNAGYKETVEFIKRVINLERVVSVKNLEIERKDEILPFQKVTLTLTTYTLREDAVEE